MNNAIASRRGRKKSAAAASTVSEHASGAALQLEFDYGEVGDAAAVAMLKGYEGEIKAIIHQSLENVVRLGQIFTNIKDKLVPWGQWKQWLAAAFDGEISEDTAKNWMNVTELYQEYATKYPQELASLTLRSLYKLSTSGVDVQAKEAVFELVAAREINTKDTNKVLQTYRKIMMENAGIEPEVAKLLTKVEVAQHPKELVALQRLSKVKQGEVAQVLAAGGATTTKEALKLVKEATAPQLTVDLTPADETTAAPAVAVTFKRQQFSSLAEVEPATVQLALVEAPLSFSFVEDGSWRNLTAALADVLAPGGFALITVGHKAAMFTGDATVDALKAVHLVCLRRQPGNSRTIVGLNIASASVFMVLAYKPPYAPPKSLMVDLQTMTDTEAIAGLDGVESGLERGFKQLMEALLSANQESAVVLHHCVGANHFSIKEYLEQAAVALGATEFIAVY